MIDDNMLEEDHLKARDNSRARLMRQFGVYNDNESYGMSNDDFDLPTSVDGEPLPYLEPTQQDPDGYLGLDPPLGG